MADLLLCPCFYLYNNNNVIVESLVIFNFHAAPSGGSEPVRLPVLVVGRPTSIHHRSITQEQKE